MFNYVNQPIITTNDVISNYFEVSNNVRLFPKYTKNFDLSMEENITCIVDNAVRGFDVAVRSVDFNSSITLNAVLDDYYTHMQADSSSIITRRESYSPITYYQDSALLRHYGVRNSDLIKFVDNFVRKKNINGISYYKNELYYS
jgi:hypothetical protein